MTSSAPAEYLKALTPFAKEYQCPECKSWALFVKPGPGAPRVRCRKCGFTAELAVFAVKYMGFKVQTTGASILIPDIYGGPAKVKALDGDS